MTAVYYFSGSGHSLAVADFFAKQLNCKLVEMGSYAITEPHEDVAVVVFPVYCQNIPQPVKVFLKGLTSRYVILIATYGRISYGNVIFEASKTVRGGVIAGAYVPIGHTFLNGDFSFDESTLLPILERAQDPRKAYIPKTRKNPLADILPAWRSRVGVKIIKTDKCLKCRQCEKSCPMGAIKNGVIGKKCIRCLRCVTACPHKALQFKNRWILDNYLKRYSKDEPKLYL